MNDDLRGIWGDPDVYDPDLNRLDEWEIKKLLVLGEATVEDIGNEKGILRMKDGRWTMLFGGWKTNRWPTEEEARGLPDTTYSRTYDNWDPDAWLTAFGRRTDKRQPRKEAFAFTIQAAKKGRYTTSKGNAVRIPSDGKLIKGTKLYTKQLHPDLPEQVYETEVSFENEDALAVAERLVRSGSERVALLNPADRKTPGGQVYKGMDGQEETIFRRSDCFLSLCPYAQTAKQYGLRRRLLKRYPLKTDFGGCFSPNVTVFRGTEREGYPFLEEPWRVNIIAVPVPKHWECVESCCGEERIAANAVPTVRNKIRTVFNIAIEHRMETLVLGAFRRGKAEYPQRHMAELFAQILEEPPYRGRFRKIVFAFPEAEDFRDVFSGKPSLKCVSR